MGFLDTLKNLFGGAKARAEQAMNQVGQHGHPGHGHPGQHPGHPGHGHPGHAHAYGAPEQHQAEEEEDSSEEAFDLAGFNPEDEETFFDAMRHMESEGMFGGTDESRAEIMQRFGIRDRMHWQTVRDSVFSVLARKYGSIEEVSQRQVNWSMGQMQRHQQQQTQRAAASGELNPVEGISLEKWAAMNAAIASGMNHEDLLRSNGIDPARWERVSGEWNARMARDTTFAITTVYGNAFQAASQGKYGDYAREANAARAANRELSMEPPMTIEQYWEILYEQDYGSKQGRDPIEVLKGCGLTVVDWTDLSAFMGYYMNRTVQRNWQQFNAMHEAVKAKFAAKYPGVTTDVDIKF
ncbi:MAG: hypothetical protein R3B48_23965 [Kofleriaceae bacterium]